MGIRINRLPDGPVTTAVSVLRINANGSNRYETVLFDKDKKSFNVDVDTAYSIFTTPEAEGAFEIDPKVFGKLKLPSSGKTVAEATKRAKARKGARTAQLDPEDAQFVAQLEELSKLSEEGVTAVMEEREAEIEASRPVAITEAARQEDAAAEEATNPAESDRAK